MNRLWFVLVGLLLYNAVLSWLFMEQQCFAHSSNEQSGGLWHRLAHGQVREGLEAPRNVTRPLHKNPACRMPATTIVRNSDRAREFKYIEFWKQLTPEYIQSRKRVWQNAVALVPERPPAGLFELGTRGIVSTAGNRDTIQRVLTMLKLLRHVNSTLPMEIWHFPGEINEESSAKLARWGAKTRDITDQSLPSPFPPHKYLQEKNYHIKAASIINSRFQEVLYLDSDNLPLRDPVSLFETPDYIDTGALFWPDFWKTHPLNPIWEMMGVECRDEWEQEAGQLVVDKQRHWRPLHLAHHLNLKHEFYFQFINGDKDTFRFAWLALNATSAWPRRYLASLGFRFRDKFCGHTMVQADFPNRQEVEEAIRLEGNREGIDNDPPLRYIFAHANLIKDIPDSAFDGKPFTQLKRYVGEAGITFLKPTIYLTDEPDGIGGCVDLLSGEGEPATMVEDFEAQWFPNFNVLYKALGGRGATPAFDDKPNLPMGMDKLLPKCMLCLSKERAEEVKLLSQFAGNEDDL